MADFSQYGGLSDEFQALWAQQPPPNFDQDDIPQLQKAQNAGREAVSAEVFKQYAGRLTTQDFSIPTRDGSTIQARSYALRSTDVVAKPLPLYIHFHGGGFCFGTLDSEDGACAIIATSTPVVVLNVNYRHTPDHVYPTAWDDAEDAFRWASEHAPLFHADPQNIILGGISAGSGLVASLTQTTLHSSSQTNGTIKGQILMIPVLVSQGCYAPQFARMESQAVSSFTQNEFAPILPQKTVDRFNRLLRPEGGASPLSDRRANPGNASAEEVRGLPPTVFGVAGADVLRDEGLLYAQLLGENGVPTDVHVFKGVPHGFRRFGAKLSMCQDWDRVIQDGIRWILDGAPEKKGWTVHA